MLIVLFLTLYIFQGVAKTKPVVEARVEYITLLTYLLGPQEKHPIFKEYRFHGDKPFRIYELDIPKDILSGFFNLLVEFNYEGSTAQVYNDSVLIKTLNLVLNEDT